MSRVLIDTSVWLRFVAGREPFASRLDSLLERREVLGHELIYGELLIGDRGARRATLLESYAKLPYASVVTHTEVVDLVIARSLRGQGIGWIDAQLVASALVDDAPFWTADESLRLAARSLKIEPL